MGHSEFDPAANDRRPLATRGRMVGVKRALKPQQVWAICGCPGGQASLVAGQCDVRGRHLSNRSGVRGRSPRHDPPPNVDPNMVGRSDIQECPDQSVEIKLDGSRPLQRHFLNNG